jgi:hypothetical protein
MHPRFAPKTGLVPNDITALSARVHRKNAAALPMAVGKKSEIFQEDSISDRYETALVIHFWFSGVRVKG